MQLQTETRRPTAEIAACASRPSVYYTFGSYTSQCRESWSERNISKKKCTLNKFDINVMHTERIATRTACQQLQDLSFVIVALNRRILPCCSNGAHTVHFYSTFILRLIRRGENNLRHVHTFEPN